MIAPSLTLLVATACGRQAAPRGPEPADPTSAVTQFLAAVKAHDLSAMGMLWGTAKGPAARSMPRDDLEKRLTVIQSYLVHESYAVEPGAGPGEEGNERVVRVQLTRKGCTPVVPFTVVRWGSGWLVKAIDLEAAGNPARPCS